MKKPGAVESVLLLQPARLAIGFLFLFSGWMKLQPAPKGGIAGPQMFALSIRSFEIGVVNDYLMPFVTFAIPWTEVVCAIALLLGLWTRSAAALLLLLLVSFTGAIISVIARGMDVTCSCFGNAHLYCDGPVGWCKVGENAVLMALVVLILVRGGGRLSADWMLKHTAQPGADSGRL